MLAALRRLFHRPPPLASGEASANPMPAPVPTSDIDQFTRDLDEALKRRRAERIARSQAAQRGVSSQWARSGARAREMFGQGGGT